MTELLNLPNVSILVAPVYLALILLEAMLVRAGKARGHYLRKDTATSISMGAGSAVTDLALAGVGYGIVWIAWEYRVATLPMTVWTMALCFLINDLKYYWSHRFGHRVRWLWANHVVHHSSQEYNLGTALRQPWTGRLTGLVVLNVPLALIGFHPALIAFVAAANLIYQFWIHTEAIDRFPSWVEAVMNTPSHHRVHHAVNPRYLDANYAGTFIVWDKLFGSFVPEHRDDPVKYGLVHDIDFHNPLRVAFHEYVDIVKDALRPGLSLGQRLAYVVAPPGWSHDGSRMGSEAIKAEFLRLHPEAEGEPGLEPARWGGAQALNRSAG
jgi:sterol desaturase/sphingolipid hydroxylase (fatty acid hydroxylase superfamily)